MVEVTSTKTVADLLHELNLSTDHVVLVDGQRLKLDALVHENDRVIVLPLITGG
jgi:sulfur carrier protein ThiS